MTDMEISLLLQGRIAALALRSIHAIETLADVEFRVTSQFGEDGILEWLVQRLGDALPDSFVEFGVEDYREANTLFLLRNRNWRGFVLDGSRENIQKLARRDLMWRHDLTAAAAFLTAENINGILGKIGAPRELGILSIDVDGNDLHLWRAIDVVEPFIVICEYNALLGDTVPITVPYDPAFMRSKAHYTWVYGGTSIAALQRLAGERGYTLVGSNRAGNNAFFVRDDLVGRLDIADRRARPARIRDSRDEQGRLTFARAGVVRARLADQLFERTDTGERVRLADLGDLDSSHWRALS